MTRFFDQNLCLTHVMKWPVQTIILYIAMQKCCCERSNMSSQIRYTRLMIVACLYEIMNKPRLPKMQIVFLFRLVHMDFHINTVVRSRVAIHDYQKNSGCFKNVHLQPINCCFYSFLVAGIFNRHHKTIQQLWAKYQATGNVADRRRRPVVG